VSNHTQKHTTKHAIDTNVIVMAISTQNHTFHTKLATTFEHTITNNLKGQNPSPATHYPHMIMHPNSNTPIPNHNTSGTNFSQSNMTQLETQSHTTKQIIDIRKVQLP